MAELFGRERLEFFHLHSEVGQAWRSTDQRKRLQASELDRLALRCMALVRSFHGQGDSFSSYRLGNAFGAFNFNLEAYGMARKTETPVRQGSSPEWKGFLEYRLTQEELDDLDSWQPDASEVMEALHGFLVDGYTFTLSWSDKTKQACFSLRDNNPERKSAGYCMTTFDGDCALALKAGVFKQKVILRDTWEALLVAGKAARRG